MKPSLRSLYVRAYEIMAEVRGYNPETAAEEAGEDFDNYFGYADDNEEFSHEEERTIVARYRMLADVGAVPGFSILLTPRFFLDDVTDDEIENLVVALEGAYKLETA